MLLTANNKFILNGPLLFILLFLKNYCCVAIYPQDFFPFSSTAIGGHVNSNTSSTSRTDATTTTTPTLAAFALCSRPFLQELVNHKETCNEKYYHFDDENEVFDIAPRKNPTHAVEYTGRLWFLRKTPLQFQETIRIKQISSCGTFSYVECVTKFKYGKNSDWTPCCTVVCKLSHTGFDPDGKPMLHVKVSSDMLLQLPLFGTRNTITKKICNVFTKAAHSFLSKKESTKMVGCHYNIVSL
mmetsp:Transcript_12958/g.24351  ORF Transcript_12958/g.24351 Transcript_12958/m.24351 type:complete len:241 (+) Transcript_12958:298-1020(+)